MHILVDIGHPGDVHLFNQPIRNWQAHGHQISITTSKKDVAIDLLESYNLPYHVVGVRRPGVFNLVFLLIIRTLRIARLALRNRPDIFISVCSPTAAIASKMVGRPHVVFDDSEFGDEQIMLYKPFTEAICTPQQFERDLGKKQIRYAGFKELAYLHPSVFTPDAEVLQAHGISPDEKFFVLRLVSWDAAHDRGEHGLTQAGQDQLIQRLSAAGRVIVSYEGQPPLDISTNKHLPPEIMLHLLAYAQLFISEGLTMVTEAALLGTPAILVNTLQAGNMTLLRETYQLAETFDNDADTLQCVETWLADPALKQTAAQNRARLLADMVDVNQWITDFVENFVTERR